VDGQTPIFNVHVFASDYGTNLWVAGSNTASDGSYSLVVPAGSYRVRACPSCNNLNYIDEFYQETDSYNNATPVQASVPDDTPNINFTIAPSVPRLGDLNGDRSVDLADLVIALQVLAGLDPDSLRLKGDVNGNGIVDLAEAIYIIQIMASMR
jgi:hypothetical protein